MPSQNTAIAIVDENSLREKIHTIRGTRVMLDFDLAQIYGYSTKAFNQQVQRNIGKFDEDFMFQLTREELEMLLRSQNVTSSWGGSRYLPFAFTEQGIYMLMTVLRGELATRQSKLLIRLFKQMKDAISSNQMHTGWKALASLSLQVGENSQTIGRLKEGLAEVADESAHTKDVLAEFMASFDKAPFNKEYVILQGQALEAVAAYQQLFNLAKSTVYIIDNYIGPKTLLNLKGIRAGVSVTVFSDNVGKGLSQMELDEFKHEYPQVPLTFKRTNDAFHDRFVILDYGLAGERVFVCGGSSKDAGRRTTVIMESEAPAIYHGMVDELLSNSMLRLS